MRGRFFKAAAVLCAVAVIGGLSACQTQTASIGASPVPMGHITQDSKDGYITFSFDMPENWTAGAGDQFSVGCYDKEQIDSDATSYEELPLVVHISNYPCYSRDSSITRFSGSDRAFFYKRWSFPKNR